MRIPHIFNPLGKSPGAKYFELVVKPGILAADMTYGFTPYWNAGGYCSVDWGDGSKETAAKSATALKHTYAEAGTYKIKIIADCYWLILSTTGPKIVSYSSDAFHLLGGLTVGNQMFQNCANTELNFTRLPESLTAGRYMFRGCSNALLPLNGLPAGLTNGQEMFSSCSSALLYLTELPAGLTAGTYMFYKCSNAVLQLKALPDGITNGNSMFYGCTDAALPLTSLPTNLADGTYMFYGCKNAKLAITKLPNGLTTGTNMFNNCTSSQMRITELPDGLTSATSMFGNCSSYISLTKLPPNLKNVKYMFDSSPNVEINLDDLVANAPEEGWPEVTDLYRMFANCPKVTGSRSAFMAKFPNAINKESAFSGTNTTA